MDAAADSDRAAVRAVRRAVAEALGEGPTRVLVGFSGGLDSTVLLHAAAALAPGRLCAVHVDHGLHPDSAHWAERCRRTALGLGADFELRRVSVDGPGGIEANARRARYGVFDGLLHQGETLLLGHHRDDQVETVLLRRLQGRGSYGMPGGRPLGAGTLKRPLLSLPRSHLARYAVRERLSWIEDPANRDLRHRRNEVRHRLLPALRTERAGVDAALLNAAERAAADEQATLAALGGAVGSDSVPRSVLGSGEDATDRLRAWLTVRLGATPRRAALREFLRQVDSGGRDRQPALAVGGSALRGYRGVLYLLRPQVRPAADAVHAVEPPADLSLAHGLLRIESVRGGFRPAGPLRVAFRQGGERLRGGGVTKPLKQWFQEAGVPPWRREDHPILLDDAGVLAIPGIAVRDDAATRGGGYRARWCPAGSAASPG